MCGYMCSIPCHCCCAQLVRGSVASGSVIIGDANCVATSSPSSPSTPSTATAHPKQTHTHIHSVARACVSQLEGRYVFVCL